MYFSMIPYSFIYNCVFLCWRDVLWGYEHKLVGWEFVVGMADFHVSNGSTKPLEVDLICLNDFDIQEIESGLYSLAGCEENLSVVDSKTKWLFIVLKWLFENKDAVADPLEMVELIYEDFDFFPEIESFVRYMPPTDGYKPEEHSLQQNLERLFCNWHDFLEKTDSLLKVNA
ncbi:DUF2247 family protein [Pseudomonas edaphica]|uniref:DUF2247 family protein n=1 Tax=Pseudomonas edaphica TaxID=2006980 RepID=A0ABY2U8G5_9PSED|nr:DUF2247 family protein [Pseudomonas edaphica]TLG90648.1 DUF2247 family protein [Pseudomonas edaphica]